MITGELREFWLVNTKRPWRPAQPLLCKVTACDKIVKLETSGGKTFIYGSSGFGTQMAADWRRRELMRKIVRHPYGWRFDMYGFTESHVRLEWERFQ